MEYLAKILYQTFFCFQFDLIFSLLSSSIPHFPIVSSFSHIFFQSRRRHYLASSNTSYCTFFCLFASYFLDQTHCNGILEMFGFINCLPSFVSRVFHEKNINIQFFSWVWQFIANDSKIQ